MRNVTRNDISTCSFTPDGFKAGQGVPPVVFTVVLPRYPSRLMSTGVIVETQHTAQGMVRGLVPRPLASGQSKCSFQMYPKGENLSTAAAVSTAGGGSND